MYKYIYTSCPARTQTPPPKKDACISGSGIKSMRHLMFLFFFKKKIASYLKKNVTLLKKKIPA